MRDEKDFFGRFCFCARASRTMPSADECTIQVGADVLPSSKISRFADDAEVAAQRVSPIVLART